MKELVILSGKGGVGKTSITASIAALLPDNLTITLADTDVDAPNLNIITGASPLKSAPVYAAEKAVIEKDRCSGCMQCTTVCSFRALLPGNGAPVVLPLFCEACGACVTECPEHAITIERVQNGYLHLFVANGKKLVSGELTVGQGGSGKIVDLVKNEARAVAHRDNADYLIIDGPPGIGCPVISSLKGCDAVLAITEPTAAALSDLERLLEVITYFDPAIGIIINKADINPKGAETIRRRMSERGIRVIGEIPYDIHMPLAITRGVPIALCFPESPAAEALRRMPPKVLSLFDTKQRKSNNNYEQNACMRQQ